MTHRSNQAVASQDQAAPQPDRPIRAPPLVTAWAVAIAALLVSAALISLGLWLVRLPLAGLLIGAALADRGAEADFRVTQLGWSGATLEDVRFGPEAQPDARIDTAQIRWRWRGLSPNVTGIQLVEPRLRLRVDPNGRVSVGALDRLRGEPSRRRPSVPAIRIDVEGGRASIAAPFGELEATFQTSGVLGQDFTGRLQVAETTTRASPDFALERGSATLSAISQNGDVALLLDASAAGLIWAGATLNSPSAHVTGRAPLDLSQFDLNATWRADAARASGVRASGFVGAIEAEAHTHEHALTFASWNGAIRATIADARIGGARIDSARLEIRAAGDNGTGRGGWSLSAARFANVTLSSSRPSASGGFTLDSTGGVQGRARVSLNQAQLTRVARARLRAALPDLAGAPVGPAFARARQTLDAAGAAFDVVIPLAHAGDRRTARVWISDPAEARAATGAVVRLSALRDDAPAMTFAWPGLAMHGVLALELSGGGAPDASLLLDSADWAPDAPFEADGTLTLANWRASGSSISANEIGIGLYIAPDAGGRVELIGPARVTGPLGDGEVRDLVANLDLAVIWSDAGWRAAPRNSCQRMTLGGIEAAGLAFSNGAFALCPLGGALIAANARGDLSGGFTVQRLALAGRMAGPGAQPARLSAASIIGRFRGHAGSASLALEASAPALAVDLSDARTLELTLHRLTAEARLAREWGVDGAFEQGLLTDPNLPGSVSAIAGRWRAAPEGGAPVIYIDAGEALLTANRPETTSQRPLFNPLRLVNTSGVLRAGRIEAQGAVVLAGDPEQAEQTHRDVSGTQVAQFTAHHDVRSGAGGAQIAADNLMFSEALQPYDITERARGLVDNVRGPATIVGDVTWTNESIDARGRVELSGVSLSTSTIPIVQGVRGEIQVDDLFALTTPPGQSVTVDLVNPGIAVGSGRVRFQLIADQHVVIEQADFDFASGTLSMQPTTIRLGADETQFVLTMSNVDAADLLAHLNIPDLSVTGRVEGRFPLLLTRRSAIISDGLLRARSAGTIAYTGGAGAGATGAAQVAFDALRSFNYNELALTLDGDLSGEVVSSIIFRGQNSGRPVDLGPIAPIPGVGRVEVRGVPFTFNVRVTAPFRRLAETVASITDPGALLDRAQEIEAPAPVDQPAPTPR